ncbi:hypothetical protein Pondi_00022 [Escherichia phage Pondi]|nr:hypothetical protein Pondi_00022 [Escherichia phage Pondi]
MKTLSHYQKLREDYACIISKNAPAWELIEAIDDLIKLMTSDDGRNMVDVAPGLVIEIPTGWTLNKHDVGYVKFTLHDQGGGRGGISERENCFVTTFDNITLGNFSNARSAFDCLSKHAMNSVNQPHFLGVPVNLPKGWGISIHHDSNTISLLDHNGYRVAAAYQKIKGNYGIWWEGKYYTTLKTQREAIEWLNDKANIS